MQGGYWSCSMGMPGGSEGIRENSCKKKISEETATVPALPNSGHLTETKTTVVLCKLSMNRDGNCPHYRATWPWRRKGRKQE